MTNEERISALEQEVAELKRGLEARPIDVGSDVFTIDGKILHISGDCVFE